MNENDSLGTLCASMANIVLTAMETISDVGNPEPEVTGMSDIHAHYYRSGFYRGVRELRNAQKKAIKELRKKTNES